MTKYEVLKVFAENGGLLTPDGVRARLRSPVNGRSLYSYLLRLSRQGLLRKKRTHWDNKICYALTERGWARLESVPELPGRVTLAWLWQHIPASILFWLLGLLAAASIFGATVGQIEWVQKLIESW